MSCLVIAGLDCLAVEVLYLLFDLFEFAEDIFLDKQVV
jgi:hypothetical protein